jgi:hypothetical protein
MSGDENDYVVAYKAANPAFPHETTMDQLFSEEQFEAYRALGEHIARRLVEGKDAVAAFGSDQHFLLSIIRAWYPAPPSRQRPPLKSGRPSTLRGSSPIGGQMPGST